MALLVQKYGGTSVADPDRIHAVADNIAFTKRRGDDVIAVVSAMGKTTDRLIGLADSVSRTQPGREMDMLLTTGERQTAALMTMALADRGIDAISFTGSQVGIITDTDFLRFAALVLDIFESTEAGDRLAAAELETRERPSGPTDIDVQEDAHETASIEVETDSLETAFTDVRADGNTAAPSDGETDELELLPDDEIDLMELGSIDELPIDDGSPESTPAETGSDPALAETQPDENLFGDVGTDLSQITGDDMENL